MPIIYRTSYLLLHHYSVGATIETEWLGFVNSEQLRTSLQEVLRLARQHRIRSYVANNVLLRAIRPADQDWINEVWFPDFARLGVQRLAIVVSQDGLNRMGIDNIMQRATTHVPYDTQYFADAATARNWAAVASASAEQTLPTT
ncbi:hypothetical protein [Hymenobacter bucti]|uniref:STAS/SEC14 domain-containing protein n=1 Tax=Hymenobacter bucti TaxID=1844114 RepID=A0ABW4QX97_9BACT